MRRALTLSILAFSLLAVIGCNRSNDGEDSVGTKDTYSLCPKTDDSRQGLYEEAKIFADTQKAKFIDRSAGAQQELSDIGSAVLKKYRRYSCFVNYRKARRVSHLGHQSGAGEQNCIDN